MHFYICMMWYIFPTMLKTESAWKDPNKTPTHLPVTLVAGSHSLEQRFSLRVFHPRAVKADHLPPLARHSEDFSEKGLGGLSLLVRFWHKVVRPILVCRQQVLNESVDGHLPRTARH